MIGFTVEGLEPRDVDVEDAVPPLVDTFGRTELEFAAALFVLACRDAGGWRAMLPREIGIAMKRRSDGELAKPPWWGNPFLRPDFRGLVDRGFARLEPTEGGELFVPLPAFFERLHVHVLRTRERDRQWREAWATWRDARRWEDDGGRAW